ncbi:GDSL-type esterase/lipase family protein [Agriterribacter sp.]|uniref:GDSL-type esterase/lipase family protein n=1 Tax=Agriterribacter sp. TaxID=2821509 RepID=UPI002C7A5882|nr:GDSL-type esterase/lipase family protein [Agriterribacter sp.]HRP57828.1 GDSL-type esterase/lipase family protein [Agriterribacter sp.]
MSLYRSVFYLFLLAFTAVNVSAQQKEIKVACIGNSVTYGAGHKNPQLSSYPSQLQKLLGEKYEVRNFGRSGATLLRKGHNPYNKTAAFEEALAFDPDIAVMHLGLNDTDPRNWPNYRDEFAPDYAWLIDTIRQVNPSVKIYICRLSPISNGHPRFLSGTRDWYGQIQELIPQIAEANNTGLIDFNTPLYSRPELLPDNIHPNEAGAALLAKQVYQQLSGDFGGLQLPVVFAPHMVLQRNKPIKFYGTANAGEKISISFNGKQQVAVAGDNGQWNAPFPAMPAGGPFKAVITSPGKTIALDDILIGDVWLCSGQSNMAFPLQAAENSKIEMEAAQKSNRIRLLNRKVIAETDNKAWDPLTLQKVNELEYFSGTWERCDSGTAKNFSAVAYYFGKKLQQQLNVPIGLIQVAVGGSTTESWIDRYTMEHHPVLVNELYNWRKSDFFQPWVRERADTNLKNSTDPKQRHPYEPCYNYEAGIKPLVNFPIEGVIWYQGESNAHNIELHEIVFPELVKSWRKQWGYEFPFYYVQLSSLNRPSWPSFRNSQLQLLKIIPNAGMAVSSDVGDPTDVHPRNKKPVGERLARLALHFNYQQKSIVPSGPLPLNIVKQNSRIVISFQYAQMLKTNDGETLRGFRLLNDKGQQTDMNAFIQNNKVIIPFGKEQRPVAVLYGWEPFTNANLVNGEGLPASTFKIKIN